MEEATITKLPQLSKRKLRGIDPYGGKNAMIFDDDGKLIPKSEAKKRSAYMDTLERDKEVVIRDAEEMSSDSDQHQAEKHVMRVKKELMVNKDLDEKFAKERVREKRIKAKKRLREEMGIAPKE